MSKEVIIIVRFYISFSGNCFDAISFYKNVFNSDIQNLVWYSDLNGQKMPKNNILHSEMRIEGSDFIFNDYTSSMTIGDNFSIVLELGSDEKVKTYFYALSEGGEICLDIGPLELPSQNCSMYANFTDKFSINWILLCKKK